MLKIKNLTVYSNRNNNKKYLIKDICFSLEKGDSLGIIGKSGSGKSTLAKALLHIFDNNVYLESGDIFINNNSFDNKMRGKHISLLFQNPNTYLNPLMKVGKQISEMLIYHNKYDKKAAKEKTLEFMKKFGIEQANKIYNYYPYEISGGMQQKICLCICLICNPDIVIFDESFSFLDTDTKQEILTIIKNYQKETNCVLILISHDFKEIYNMCNKIAIMNDGMMVEFGTKNEIVLQPRHPHTQELLMIYLSFFKSIYFTPIHYEVLTNNTSFTILSDTHYVRGIIQYKNTDYDKIKEEIYEHLNA